jgi:hypothetical protein
MILSDAAEAKVPAGQRGSWMALLKLPQTWGAIAAKTLTDPVWFFIADWFPLYLIAKGIPAKTGLLAFWVPFVGADLGNFFGGWASGYLIKRGWSLGAARKAVVIFGGIGVHAAHSHHLHRQSGGHRRAFWPGDVLLRGFLDHRQRAAF